MNNNNKSPWFIRFNQNPGPSVGIRLFCFPYAGGNASIFEPWARELRNVDVVAVQLPGRGVRFAEKPLESMTEIVAAFADAFEHLSPMPFAIFGHSNGALIGFEVARELRRRGNGDLKHIFLSAAKAPHLPKRRGKTYDLPYDQFIDELRSINGTPEEILTNKSLMALVVPALRADFKINQTYQYVPEVRLAVSASLFTGLKDVAISDSDMLAWQEHLASDNINYKVFQGDHFFIHSHQHLVLDEVHLVLEQLQLACSAEQSHDVTA